jgi:hypothetical protein
MNEEKNFKEKRIRDPYMDRRSGEERRQVYDSDYYENGGMERRSGRERRQNSERRRDCIKISQWSSVCAVDKD